jgi:hypothetical protein
MIVMANVLDPNKLNKSLFLQGAISFTQFNVQGKLITAIGELHLSAYKSCPSSPSTTVADYIKSIMKTNSDSKILMEYIPGLEELNTFIGSKNMADTFKMLKEEKISSRSMGFDIRSTFLRPNDRDVLYYKWKLIEDLPRETVEGVFINAIPAAIIPSLEPSLKSIKNKQDQAYLQSFLDDMNNHSIHILNEMKQWNTPQTKDKIIRMIQHLWKKVTDYALIKEILTQKSGSIIVICGEQHALNLLAILGKPLFRVVAKTKDDCLNLRGSALHL